MTTNVENATKAVRNGAAGTATKSGALSPLQESVQQLVGTVTDRAIAAVSDKILDATGRLNEYAEGGGGGLLAAVTGAEKLAEGASPLKAAVSAGIAGAKQTVKDKAAELKDKITGGGGGGKTKKKKQKITNIIEEIDVGVPVRVAYDEWTQFESFPHFMKKLDQVEQVSDEKLKWKAQVFWSHRTWESTIIEQVPEERIVWRSKGAKGYVDGAVTFHELTPDLTHIMVVLEYHPHGLFEKTGNIWRAQGRRMRLELKHFQRHVMTQSILRQEEIEGWPGEIRDSKVVNYGEEEESEGSGDVDDRDEDVDEDDRDAEVDETSEQDELDESDDQDDGSDADDAKQQPKRTAGAGRSRSSGHARRRQGVSG